jgi:hypothetical protein
MADLKISQLTGATTPLAGTEVTPIVQSGTTKKVAVDDLTVKNIRSNATTGILQVAGPAAGTTRTMTTPNANFTAARTDAAQTFTGIQTFSNSISAEGVNLGAGAGAVSSNLALGNGGATLGANTSGASNVAIGQQAGANITTGSNNVAIGVQALFGGGVALTEQRNTAVGVNAGQSTQGAGGFNTYLGSRSGFANTTSQGNTYLGEASGYSMTGASNSVLGRFSGNDGTTNLTSSSGTIVLSDGIGNARMHFDGSNWIIANTNLAFGTAAKGVNFTANTPAAGMTSQLLNWYEEGTWTPNQGSGLTVVGTFGSSGTYTRVGRLVYIRGQVTGTTSVAAAASALICTNLPFTAASGQSSTGAAVNDAVSASATILVANATIYAVQAIVATPGIGFSATYQV